MSSELRITTTIDGDTAFVTVAGDVTPAAEAELAAAHARTVEAGVAVVALDFTGLGYLNSGGIGLLVTLLVRAKRSRQRLIGFGLNDHYREIFALTRLDDAIELVDDREAVTTA